MKLFVVMALAFCFVAFQNCSKVNFSAAKSSDGSYASLGTDGFDGGLSGPGSPTAPGSGPTPAPGGRGPASVSELPQVHFSAPLCQPHTNCVAYFTLAQAVPYETSFYWQTNDSGYKTLVPADSSYVIGIPNYHYVPVGHTLLTFAPGETQKIVNVQNINPTSSAIFIPVHMDTCVYDGAAVNCTSIFN
jgi:hypothetical protein